MPLVRYECRGLHHVGPQVLGSTPFPYPTVGRSHRPHICMSQVHTPEEEPATLCSRPGRDPLGFLGMLEHGVIDLF